MKKIFVFLCVMVFMAGVAQAQDRGTAKEAQAMVKKAAAYVKEVGKDKAMAEFNNPKGKFIYKDLYIFAGTADNMVTLAHPITPALIGKSMITLKDADGKLFLKEAVEKAKKDGSGTVTYRWSHPKTKKVEKKATYFELVDGVIVYCGYYM
ncbi:MAG: hypothetical protein CSYNP_02148 [Syntrophus sp. SKADARSKE-3]|nr:hypothetical protein [Syntrophus sp. SKADARSKE-3]